MAMYAHHMDLPEHPTEYEVASAVEAMVRCLDDPDKHRGDLAWWKVRIKVHKLHKTTRVEIEVPGER